MKQITPLSNTETTPAPIKPVVKRNHQKKGIEMSFGHRLDAGAEKPIMDKGWQWSNFHRHYYIRYSPEALHFANTFSVMPGTTDAAAGMIDANEEAAYDNFCLNNNI